MFDPTPHTPPDDDLAPDAHEVGDVADSDIAELQTHEDDIVPDNVDKEEIA